MPAHRRRPIVAVVAGESILLGHGMAPGGVCYANRLKGWMNLAHIGGWECQCGELCVVDVGGRAGDGFVASHVVRLTLVLLELYSICLLAVWPVSVSYQY